MFDELLCLWCPLVVQACILCSHVTKQRAWIFFLTNKYSLKGALFLAFHLVCKLPNCKAACLRGFYNPSLFIHVTDEFLLCCSACQACYLFEGKKKKIPTSNLRHPCLLLSPAGGKKWGASRVGSRGGWKVGSTLRNFLPQRATSCQKDVDDCHLNNQKGGNSSLEFGKDELPHFQAQKAHDYPWPCSQKASPTCRDPSTHTFTHNTNRQRGVFKETTSHFFQLLKCRGCRDTFQKSKQRFLSLFTPSSANFCGRIFGNGNKYKCKKKKKCL